MNWKAGRNYMMVSIVALSSWACTQPISSGEDSTPSVVDFNQKSTKLDTSEICRQALQLIRNRDFRTWRGLPSKCDWTALSGTLPTIGQDGHWSRPFVSSGNDYWSVNVELDGYTHCYLTFADTIPIVFDGQNPKLIEDAQTLIETLGEPTAKLDWYNGILRRDRLEWVYPDRGITLFLGSENSVAFVSLFAPTTLEDYEANLRLDEKKEYR